METIDFAPTFRSQTADIAEILQAFNENRNEADGRLEFYELEEKIAHETLINGEVLNPLSKMRLLECIDRIKENMAAVVMVVLVSSIFEARNNYNGS